jgi:hypothetical protein
MPENKVLVYCVDQFGKPLEATVTLDNDMKFAQEAAGQYAAVTVDPGRRTATAVASGCGYLQFELDVPVQGRTEHRVVLPRFDMTLTPSTTVPFESVLKAGTSPPLGEEYSCTWEVVDTPPEIEVGIYKLSGNECLIATNQLEGDQTIRLTVQFGDRPYKLIREQRFTVSTRKATKPQEQSDLYAKAQNLAIIFKQNLDTKLHDLNTGISALGQRIGGLGGGLNVQLLRSHIEPSATRPIWIAIRNRTEAMSVSRLEDFLNAIFCQPGVGEPNAVPLPYRNVLGAIPSFHDVHSYELLRTAVEAFLIQECGVAIRRPGDGPVDRSGADVVPGVQPQLTFREAQQRLEGLLGLRGRLPYVDKVVRQIFQGGMPEGQYVNPLCYGILAYRDQPCLIELIWSYWHEEGMLVQTMAAITRRFQNVRGPGERDPLTNLTLEPLRPLSNLLFGYLQDERDRLSLVRRAYEYDNEYGIRLVGRAVPVMRTADSRSKFLEAFHNLLFVCSEFYLQADDTTVVADGFKVLNSLREVHLLLSQGAHNQYNDLVWRSRAEMLLEQWLLGREELRQFLPSRPMVVYPERWMAQVDTMKSLQGWTDTSVIHFGNLARFGEQLLLSIRFDDWNDPGRSAPDAADWAIFWRPQIQGYTHEYRTVTGVDLSAPINASAGAVAERYAQPSAHLRRRATAQR